MRSARARSGVAIVAAALLGAGTVATLTVAPATPAFAAGPTVCTATGGTPVTTDTLIDGIRWNVHVFNADGTFTPGQSTNVEYLLVGGGGGGGGARANSNAADRGQGGGGGSGRVLTGSALTISSAQSITRGIGGLGGNVSATGTTGGTSSIGALVTAAGGGGGGSPNAAGPGGNGASGGGGAGDSVAQAGGTASAGNIGGAGNLNGTVGVRAGGGGGGPGGAGGNASASTGGTGGGGAPPNNITGTLTTYGGGGGGGGATPGAGGGAGGAGSVNGTATAGTTNRGGGGGGAGATNNTTRTGGAGGSGIVVIRYPRYCLNPSPPTSAAMTGGGAFSWGAPVYVPASQSVTSYTVVYQLANTTCNLSACGIYARGAATLNMNVSGKTIGDCQVNNPLGTHPSRVCLLANGPLVSGQTYFFRVFARTASSLGQMTASFSYTAP